MSSIGKGFRQYYRAVIRRLWLVLLLAALIAGLVFWRVGARPRTFSAAALIMVNAPVFSAPLTITDDHPPDLASNLMTVGNDITHLIGTRTVAEQIAARLNVKNSQVVQRRVRLSRVRDSDLFKIRGTWSDPQMAARLANTAMTILIDRFRDLNRQDAREFRVFVEQQLALTRTRLGASDRAIEAYKLSNGILTLDQEVQKASTDLGQLRNERETAQRELSELRAKIATAQSRLARETHMRVVSGTIKENPVFSQLESQLTTLLVSQAALSQTYTDAHPRMKVLKGQIADVRQQLRGVARKILDNETSQVNPIYDQLIERLADDEVNRAAVTARIAAIRFSERQRVRSNLLFPRLQTGLNQLIRENEALDTTYSNLSEQYQDALLRENQAGYMPAAIQVMEQAVAPTAPEGIAPPVLSAIGALLGLLLGIMAALLLESADDRIRSPRDAEEMLGAPVLAEVPDVAPPRRLAPATAALLVILGGLILAAVTLAAAGRLPDILRQASAAPWIHSAVHTVAGVPGMLAQIAR